MPLVKSYRGMLLPLPHKTANFRSTALDTSFRSRRVWFTLSYFLKPEGRDSHIPEQERKNPPPCPSHCVSLHLPVYT